MSLFLRDVYKFLDKFENVVYHLAKNEKWDMFFLVFSVTDWIQHRMWKHIDKTHPSYNPKISLRYKRHFVNFWKRIDNILKNILALEKDVNLLLISDHGFGSNDQTFNLARWLEMKGYLVKKSNLGKGLKKIVYKALKLLQKLIERLFPYKMIKRVNATLKVEIIQEIDFKKSKAYCLGHTIPFGAIYINAKSKKGRNKIKSKLMKELKNLSKEIKKDVKVQIYEPRKLYTGKKSLFLPDIIFTINNWRCVIIEDNVDRPLFEENSYSKQHTGSHRVEGIFLAYGPDIKDGGEKIKNVKIYDIAPTVLHMFGLPIPKDMDGRVLMEIFKKNSKLRRKPKYVDPSYYRESEKERIRKRVKMFKAIGKI